MLSIVSQVDFPGIVTIGEGAIVSQITSLSATPELGGEADEQGIWLNGANLDTSHKISFRLGPRLGG